MFSLYYNNYYFAQLAEKSGIVYLQGLSYSALEQAILDLFISRQLTLSILMCTMSAGHVSGLPSLLSRC